MRDTGPCDVRGCAGRFRPGVADVVFLFVLTSVLVGGHYRLLNDPGTFWHVRLGNDILRERAVPRVDTLTFSRAGTPWVDQSWLFDAGLAGVVGVGGWSTAGVLSALLLAWLYSDVAGRLAGDGRSAVAALGAAVLAAGLGSTHFLVRPHLFTLALFWLTLRLCQAQHERGGWWLAAAPPLTALWANLHGGFLAGPVVVAVAGAGHAISGPWDRTRSRQTAAFLVTAVLCLVAALVNPYGPGLYRHVAGLLWSSGVTDLIEEYRPLTAGGGALRAAELILLALVALPTLGSSRLTRYELTHTLVWLHLGLASVRNAPLFALAVAPGLARLIDSVLPAATIDPAVARRSVWPFAAAAGLVVASLLGGTFARHDPSRWPLAALPELDSQPARTPLFHEQDWGGLIELECRPDRRAFVDDRFELFGRDEILRYLNAMEGGPDWEAIRDRDAVGLVWIRPDRPLARRLDADPAWAARHRDATSVLFARIGTEGREPAVAGRTGDAPRRRP